MTEPTPDTRTIVIEREMPHPPEKIWRALTQSALIREWLMENDFQLTVGRRFNFRAPPMPQWNGVVDCEVLECLANARLSYTWNSSGDEAPNGLKTIVTFTLTPTATGTLVRMEHAGFRADQEANYRGAEYGWQRNLGILQQTLGALA